MPYFNTTDGTRLFYSAWGTGHPIVLVHGNNLGSDMWSFLSPTLIERGYQCISYDQRGFGRSDSPKDGYDIDTLADDLHCFLKHLNLPKVSLVTFSVGGGILARYLAFHGTRYIDKAVLIATVTPCFLKKADNPQGLDPSIVYEPFRQGLIKDRPQLLRDSLDAFFNPSAAENPISDGLREWIVASALQNPLVPMLEYARFSNHADFRSDMESFALPALIIHGDSDVFAPVYETGLRTHKMIPGSQFILYAGASHGITFTHRDRLNRDIVQFMERDIPHREEAPDFGEETLSM